MPGIDIEVDRQDLRKTQAIEGEGAADEAKPGSVQLRVERFGLTANNVTYAVAGDALGYWRFFEPSADGWGRVPVWGFGQVVASGVEGIEPGERYYGYLPMSSYVTLEAQAGGPGFAEVSAGRADLPGFYNQYTRVTSEWEGHEDEFMILRPLFATAFLLDWVLASADKDTTVILGSASSKTAWCLAYLLHRGGGPKVVGLTSSRNRGFVEGLGFYDSAVTYDEVETLPAEGAYVFVDMGGATGPRERLHSHLADSLQRSVFVGATNWEASGGLELPTDLPGPPLEFFFAPAEAERFVAERGPEALQSGIAEAWASLAGELGGRLELVRAEGGDAVQKAFAAFVDGSADPRAGYVLSLEG